MGIESESTLPSTTFQGCSPPARKSEPMTKTGVVSPFDNFQSAKPITTGMASATPSTDSARYRLRVSISDGSSKHLVPRGMIQRSADAWSIMVVTMRPKPR